MKKLVALNAHYMHTNLALRQIMATLAKDADVVFFESNINVPYRQLLEQIARGRPTAIGFSVYIWNAALVWRLCRALREALPGVYLFAGGPEVDDNPGAVLDAHPALDGVLSGEGELNVARLLDALDQGDLRGVPGLARRVDGAVVVGERPPLLPPERFVDAYAGGDEPLAGRIVYVETSRGCPYRCGYCLSGESGAVRALDAKQAVARLTRLAERGATLIKLVDRTFNFDKARANAIWAGLIEHSARTGLTPTYHFEIGAHLLDDAVFDVLERAPRGLFQFEAGIQSSDARVLKQVGRGVSFEALREPLMRVARMEAIHLHVDLIAGLPGEGPEVFARSFDDAYAIDAQKLQLGFLKLLRGSALRRDAARLGIRFEPDPPYEVIATPAMGFEALCHLKDVERVLEWYGNSGRYGLTLRFLLAGRSPYAFFSEVARALRGMGAFECEQREKARAALLLGLYDSPEVRALMTHDLLRAGRRRELPDALAFEEDEALRAALRDQFHPVRGHSACRYEYDVETYARGDALIPRKTVVFYAPQPARER